MSDYDDESGIFLRELQEADGSPSRLFSPSPRPLPPSFLPSNLILSEYIANPLLIT